MDKLFSFIVPTSLWRDNADSRRGQANGYVAVPKSHPLFGKGYSQKVKVKNIDNVKFNGNYFGLFINALDDNREKNEISIDSLIDVHGGITYSESAETTGEHLKSCLPKEVSENPKDYWIFGFDTAHCDDNASNWTLRAVATETEKFRTQLENINEILL